MSRAAAFRIVAQGVSPVSLDFTNQIEPRSGDRIESRENGHNFNAYLCRESLRFRNSFAATRLCSRDGDIANRGLTPVRYNSHRRCAADLGNMVLGNIFSLHPSSFSPALCAISVLSAPLSIKFYSGRKDFHPRRVPVSPRRRVPESWFRSCRARSFWGTSVNNPA